MQIEDAFYQLPNPYPVEEVVGVVKQTLSLVDEAMRQVPLSEVLQGMYGSRVICLLRLILKLITHMIGFEPKSLLVTPCGHKLKLMHEGQECMQVLRLVHSAGAV